MFHYGSGADESVKLKPTNSEAQSCIKMSLIHGDKKVNVIWK